MKIITLLGILCLFGCKASNPLGSSPSSNVKVELSRYQKVMLIDKDFNLRLNLDVLVDGVTEKAVSIVFRDGKIEILDY